MRVLIVVKKVPRSLLPGSQTYPARSYPGLSGLTAYWFFTIKMGLTLKNPSVFYTFLSPLCKNPLFSHSFLTPMLKNRYRTQEDPQRTPGDSTWPPLDHFWISFGSFLDHFGITFGSVLDHFWITLGSLLDQFWIHIGYIKDTYRIHIGYLLDTDRIHIWDTYRIHIWYI